MILVSFGPWTVPSNQNISAMLIIESNQLTTLKCRDLGLEGPASRSQMLT
jgi:hypothetical protein